MGAAKDPYSGLPKKSEFFFCSKYTQFLHLKGSKKKGKEKSFTLWGVLGTFLGGLGGVEDSEEEKLPEWCPKMEGENGEEGPPPEISVLNLSMFLLGLIVPGE